MCPPYPDWGPLLHPEWADQLARHAAGESWPSIAPASRRAPHSEQDQSAAIRSSSRVSAPPGPPDGQSPQVPPPEAPRALQVAGTTERRWRRPTSPLVVFVDRHAGGAVDSASPTLWRTPRNATPATILRHVPGGTTVVLLTGEPPAADEAGLARWVGRHGAGWELTRAQLGRPQSFRATYRGQWLDGRPATVTMGRAWTWFREAELTLAEHKHAYGLLAADLAMRFDGAEPGPTPALTGAETLLRVVPRGRAWPVLDAETRRLIQANATQGRIGLAWQGGELPGLVCLDGRLMYPALCRNLPLGPCTLHGPDAELDAFAPARHYTHVTVPKDWAHVGLAPCRDEQGALSYPEEPGRSWETWLDGAELHLLRRYGWGARTLQSLAFTPYTHRGPLDGWAQRLVELYGLRSGGAGSPVEEAVAQAMRAVAIQGLGFMFSAGGGTTRSAPLDAPERVPADARNLRPEGDRLVWEADGGWEELAHPEWPAAVWGKCRARLAARALSVPRSHVVGFDTDCLYLTSDPRWEDRGRPGDFRVKRITQGPLPAPRTMEDVRR